MEIQELIRCAIMRGGTSKGIFIMKNDLPANDVLRDRIILRIFGAPDVREIDGLGGADPLTSKLAIIAPPTREDCDVDYLFGQVSTIEPLIDYVGNCGNISAAVGPFAIDEGLVVNTEPITKVRIHQVNTRKVIVAEVPVLNSKAAVEGQHKIAGVPGTGARISLDFSDSAGAITGKLLPTGNTKDLLTVEGEGEFEVSIVDAANPLVFINGDQLGITCTETPDEIDANRELLDRIEKIRSVAAQKIGLVDDWTKATAERPYIPFFAIVNGPIDYKNFITGENVEKGSMDVAIRLLFMQKMHKTYPVSGTICTVAAAMIPGTVINEVAEPSIRGKGTIRIGHPAGIIAPEGQIASLKGEFMLKRAVIDRTARCLMKGYACIPKSACIGFG